MQSLGYLFLPGRDAHASIRGYMYQVQQTMLTWLELTDGQELILERGEDFDLLDLERGELTFFQAKDHSKPFRLTNTSAREMLENAFESLALNRKTAKRLTFEYVSNAAAARERGLPKQFSSGLALWKKLQLCESPSERAELVDVLREILSAPKREVSPRTQRFHAFLHGKSPEQVQEFVRRVMWRVDGPDESDLNRLIEKRLEARLRTKAKARRCSDALFRAVIRELCKPELKRLTVESREEALRGLTKESGHSATVIGRLKWLRPPAEGVDSERLRQTQTSLELALAQGERVISLCGAPGDGKTQVARNLARARSALYIELTPNVAAEPRSWREHLSDLYRSLLRHEAPRDEERVFRRLFAALEAEGVTLLVLDNADTPAPPLRDWLPPDSDLQIVLVGARSPQSFVIELRPPNGPEFLQLVADGRATRLTELESGYVLRIAEQNEHCALVGELLRHLPTGELAALARQPRLDRADESDRTNRTLEKAWASGAMTETERRRIAFISAFGLQEIPLAWLPKTLQVTRPAPWTTLTAEGLRVHRLLGRFARSSNVDVSEDVYARLALWADDDQRLDELKSSTRLTLAYSNAFRYLLERNPLEALSKRPTWPRLAKRYVDLTPIRRMTEREMLEHLNVLFIGGKCSASHHPVVLGQLVDTLNTFGRKEDPELVALERDAREQLERWAAERTLPERFSDEWSYDDVSAWYHEAKANRRRSDLAERMSRVRAFCEATPRDPEGRWFLRSANAAMQLFDCDRGNRHRALLERDLLSPPRVPPLPRYFRLVLAARLLRAVPPATNEGKRLLALGFALCDELGDLHAAAQATFLESAIREIERNGRFEHYEQIGRIAERLLIDNLPPEASGTLGALRAGFLGGRIVQALQRSARVRDDRRGAVLLAAAIDLCCRLLEAAPWGRDRETLCQRLGSLLRDLDRGAAARQVYDAVTTERDWFWKYNHLVLARWSRHFRVARGGLEELLTASTNDAGTTPPGTLNRSCAVREELATVLALSGQRNAAKRLLAETIAACEQQGQRALAERARALSRALSRKAFVPGDQRLARRRLAAAPGHLRARIDGMVRRAVVLSRPRPSQHSVEGAST